MAKLAGVSEDVIKRAHSLLEKYERYSQTNQLTLPLDEAMAPSKAAAFSSRAQALVKHSSSESQTPDAPPIDPKLLKLIEEIKAFATNDVTPLQALNEISKWQKNL